MNRLSDHDAQLLTLKTLSLKPLTKRIKVIRTFYKNSLNDFLNKLSYDMWDTTFTSEGVNMFNAFLDTYLKIFYSSFPKKVTQLTPKSNDWISLGIKTSCNHKRELYVASKSNPKLRGYYKKSCKILSCAINEAKNLHTTKKLKNLLSQTKPRVHTRKKFLYFCVFYSLTLMHVIYFLCFAMLRNACHLFLMFRNVAQHFYW